jgi:hypothetical protein
MKLILENWKRFLTEAEGHLEPIEVDNSPPGTAAMSRLAAQPRDAFQEKMRDFINEGAEKLVPLIASGEDGASRARILLEAMTKKWEDEIQWDAVATYMAREALSKVLRISNELSRKAGPTERPWPRPPWHKSQEKEGIVIKWLDLVVGIAKFVGVKGQKEFLDLIGEKAAASELDLRPLWKDFFKKDKSSGKALLWAFSETSKHWERDKVEAVKRFMKVWAQNSPFKT